MRRRFFSKLDKKYLIGAAIVTGAVVLLALEVTNTINFVGDDTASTSETSENSSLEEAQNSATQQGEESDPVEKAKNSGSNPASSNSSSAQKKKVTPQIVFVGQEAPGESVSVRGFVDGIFEDGGTCKATFTQGGNTVTGTSEGFGNVSYTTCSDITIPKSRLSNGTWYAKLSYSSSKAEGSSSQETVEVQ